MITHSNVKLGVNFQTFRASPPVLLFACNRRGAG